MKPRLFVGSSREALDIANAIHENLRPDAEVTVWNHGIFNLSEGAVDSLLEALDGMDFGVFVFAPDDVLHIRGEENTATRDNVVFELGLFIGRLGRQRSYIFLPSEQEHFRLPTDLVGMTPAIYESDRTDNNLQAATNTACSAVRRRMSQLWSGTEPEAATGVPQEAKRTVEERSLKDTSERRDATIQDEETDDRSWRRAYFEDKDHAEAIILLEEEIEEADEEDKRHLELWLGKVKARIDFEAGVQHLENKIEEEPEDFLGYFYLSWTYEDEDLHEDAIAALDKGLQRATDKPSLLWLKAAHLNRFGDTDEAKTILEELINDSPRYESAYSTLGQILISENEKDRAKDVFKSGLKVLPRNETLLAEYGDLLTDLGENEAALAIYRKLNELHPDSASYLTLLGNVYLNLDLNGLALEAYQKANIIAEEKQAWIWGNIGNIHNNKGFYPQAVGFLKRALQLDPDSEYAADRLSKAIKQDKEEREKADKIIREQRRAAKKRKKDESVSEEAS